MLAKYGVFATIALAAIAQDTVLSSSDLVASTSASIEVTATAEIVSSESPATTSVESTAAPAEVSAQPVEATNVATLANLSELREDDSALEL
ncbi:hypothetical protein H4S02_011334, partial [Coemansia sp. RSA 2611]